MEKLHPGARWVFRFNFYGSLGLVIVLLYFYSFMRVFATMSFSGSFLSTIVSAMAGFILLLLVCGEIYARLSYNNWAYEFSNIGLKTERGIIRKKYTSIPYQRVQNVDIQRGILARILGFSSLSIQTAGSSYGGKGNFSEGYLPALDPQTAEKLRENLMAHISSKGM